MQGVEVRNGGVLALEPGADAVTDAAVLRLLAHDINNPLTAIRILAEMLLSDVPEEHRRDISDILEAADLASAAIARIAEASEPQRSRTWLPFDVAEVLQQVVSRPALREQVRLELPESLPVRGEAEALASALTDILINARGLVSQGQQVVVRGQATATGVRIVFVHSGASPFPPAMRNHLFHRRGVVALRDQRIPVSAIGLVDAYATVVGHGGTLSVEDADEEGILVVMSLPG
jgi:K+-sensing histidine kinase KdpD